MPLQWIKNRWFIVFVTAFTLFILLFLIYYVQFLPAANKAEILENELNTEKKMLEVLEEKTANEQKNIVESSFSLQKKIPVKPLTDQFILHIEKAETVSDVFIKDMGISEGEHPSVDGQEQSDISIKDEEKSDQSSELKKVTVSLSLDAENYFDFEAFLKYLESQNRIVQVEQISVEAPGERINADDEKQPLHFNVTISAFYIPELKDLIDQAPKIDSPAPANKKDPFNNFPNIEREKK
ncbi:GspMb/PilO family protein [Lederbergia citri]|uniref:Pilus assembly protein PilO n=1 Tax=Lederbergia citri TaxID=2833580 RepID=A0A942TBU6_9BACI|nr:GspMb/PilO family protein [Lederbergia citri]MBS4194830.1 hypothetical protein [Lederbergia citri]